jgi:hypothetical protein
MSRGRLPDAETLPRRRQRRRARVALELGIIFITNDFVYRLQRLRLRECVRSGEAGRDAIP